MADDDGVVIPVSADVDKASFETSEKYVARISKQLSDLEKKHVAAEKAMNKRHADEKRAEDKAARDFVSAMKQREAATRQLGEQIGIVSRVSIAAGAAITGAMFAAAQKFASSADASDQVAQRWTESMKQLDSATNLAGRGIAETLNPALSEFSSKVTKISAYLNENKEIYSMVAGAGGVLAVAGAIGLAVSSVIKLMPVITAIQSIIAASAGGTVVAAGSLAASITAAAPIVLAALIAGGLIYLIAREVANPQKDKNLIVTGGWKVPLQAPKSYGPPAPTPSDNDFQSRHAGDVGGAPNPFTRGKEVAANEYAAQQERMAAEAAYNKQRLDATKNFEDKRASLEKQATEATRQHVLAETQAMETYQASRAASIASYNTERERSEEDHQRALRNIQDDSDQRIEQLSMDRDALGLALEQKAVLKAKSDENEQYNLERRRRQQDYNERLSELDQQFALERSRRDQAFAYDMALRQAEVQAAYDMYQAIMTAAASENGYINNLANYATASGGSSSASQNSVSSANIQISGGGLTVSQTAAIARDVASRTVIGLFKSTLAVPR